MNKLSILGVVILIVIGLKLLGSKADISSVPAVQKAAELQPVTRQPVAAPSYEEVLKARVRSLLVDLARAEDAGDFERMADFTYPTVFDLFGGRNEYIAFMKQAYAEIKEEGATLTRNEIGEPNEFYVDGSSTFAVIPYSAEVKFSSGLVRMDAYYLAISSDKGATWKFINGIGLAEREVRAKVLPKLPPGLKLPTVRIPGVKEPVQD